MAVYLAVLVVYSAVHLRQTGNVLAAALVIALYMGIDAVWTRRKEKVWSFPLSALVSGLVLSVVALNGLSAIQIIFLPLLAAASKHLLRFGKSRHLFNPAAFAMLVLNLFIPSITWWAVPFGWAALLVVAAGVYILTHQKRWHVALSFLATYVIFSTVFSFVNSGTVGSLQIIPALVISATLIFFTTVMVIEPITSGFSTLRQRIVYGCLAGFFAVGVFWIEPFIQQISLDPLIAGLVMADLLAGLFFLRSKNKPTPPLAAAKQPNIMKLILEKTKQETSDARSFIFRPEQPIVWKAGQYMHYTLAHPNPDSRKTERFFTISSAPFENAVMITTRWAAEKPSSFKTALFAMKPGEAIEAVGPDGSFTVDDPNRELVFIAGGIGVTPYRSILLDLDFRKQPMNVTLLYANRTEEAVYKEELAALAARQPGLKINYFIGDSRIDEAAIKRLVPDLGRPEFYVSGPEPMVQAMEKMLLGMNIPIERIKRDYFPGYDWP